MYNYSARCTRVIDGDTVELEIDLGFHIRHTIRGRLLDVTAPEIFRGTDRANGQLAKAELEQLLKDRNVDGKIEINTYKDKTSFGRWIIELRYSDGRSINALIEAFCQTLKVPTV